MVKVKFSFQRNGSPSKLANIEREFRFEDLPVADDLICIAGFDGEWAVAYRFISYGENGPEEVLIKLKE